MSTHPNLNQKENILKRYYTIANDYIANGSKLIKEYGIINLANTNINFLKNVDIRDLVTLLRLYNRYTINKKTNKPTYTNIELRYGCSRRCHGCYIPNNTKRDNNTMSKELLDHTINALIDNKVGFIGLTGGEPLSKQTIPLIYDAVKKHPTKLFSIYTNGDYIASNGLGGLEKLHNVIYALSINGITKHDTIRGNGSLENVLKSFDVLHHHKKFFGAGITISKENTDEATSQQLMELLLQHKVSYAHFIKIRTDEDKMKMNYDEFDKIIDELNKHKKKYPIAIMLGTGRNGQGASSVLQYAYLTINPKGDMRIIRTDLNDTPIGNILDTNVEEILNNFKIKQVEKEYL